MKLRTRIAALFIAAAAITAVGAPAAASAATVSPSGLNVCTTKYVKHTGPISCWFTPSMPGCGIWYEKVVTCTRY